MYKYIVVSPTYNRVSPMILRMCLDEGIDVYFGVRQEELDKGFYDVMNSCQHVHFISLGYGLHDIGETRKRLLEKCWDSYEYVVMIDDTISSILTDDGKGTKQCIEEIISRLDADPMKDLIACFEIHRKERKYSNVPADSKYFLETPLQGYVLCSDVLKKNNVSFVTRDISGYEDAALFVDIVKHGLVVASDSRYNMSGLLPDVPKEGGCHTDFEKKVEECHDFYNKKLESYIGSMYGYYLTKCYRNSIKSLCTYLLFDMDFFRKVLVINREKNKKIIDSKFMK